MNRLIPLFYIALLFFTAVSCESNSVSGGDSEIKEYEIIPSLTEVSNIDTTVALGVGIYKGDSLLAMSKEEEYSFKLPEGLHSLQLKSSVHQSKEVEIVVQESRTPIVWNETIEPIYGVFFPMALNNEWKYAYTGYEHTDRYENEYEGTRVVEITAVNTEGKDTLFTFVTTTTFTSYVDEDRFNENQEVVRVQDTTFTENSFSSTVRKKPDNRLIVESELSPFFGLKNWLSDQGDFSYKLYSSYPLSRTHGDTLYAATGAGPYYPYIMILNGKGIVSYNYSWGHLDHGQEKYQLVESTIW